MRSLFVLGLFFLLLAPACGQAVFYQSHFEKGEIGKAPQGWIYNGLCEVTHPEGKPGAWLKLHGLGTFLPEIKQPLPGNFTLDFDFIYHAGGDGNNITELTLFSYRENDELDVLYPGQAGVRICFENFVISYLCYNNQAFTDTISAELRTDIIKEGEITPITIQVNGAELKVFVHRRLLFTRQTCLPLSMNGLRFQLRGSQAEPWIGNLKIVSENN
jgi:hypothetical protein